MAPREKEVPGVSRACVCVRARAYVCLFTLHWFQIFRNSFSKHQILSADVTALDSVSPPGTRRGQIKTQFKSMARWIADTAPHFPNQNPGPEGRVSFASVDLTAEELVLPQLFLSAVAHVITAATLKYHDPLVSPCKKVALLSMLLKAPFWGLFCTH